MHVEHSNRIVCKEKSTFLWHQRLTHISKERMSRLVKSDILPQLDFSYWDVCLDWIKGKPTKHTSKNPTTRSSQLRKLIHTNICGRFDLPSFGSEKYLITFIDDFLWYCYLYLLHEKSWSVDVPEMFINEVERQLDRKVKVVRSDRGGEYYEKFNESEHHKDSFAKWKYIWLSSRGGVNWTLKDFSDLKHWKQFSK